MRKFLFLILLTVNITAMSGQVNINFTLNKTSWGQKFEVSLENKTGSDIIILNELNPNDGNSYILFEIKYKSSGKDYFHSGTANFIDSTAINKESTRLHIKNNKKWIKEIHLYKLGIVYDPMAPDIDLKVYALVRYINKDGAYRVEKTECFKVIPTRY